MSEPLTINRRDYEEAAAPRFSMGSGRAAPRHREGDAIGTLISGIWSSYRRAGTLTWDWQMDRGAEGVSRLRAAQCRIARIFTSPMQGPVPDHPRRRTLIRPYGIPHLAASVDPGARSQHQRLKPRRKGTEDLAEPEGSVSFTHDPEP